MGINFNSNYQNTGQKSQINVKTKTLETQGDATKIDNTRTDFDGATSSTHITNSTLTIDRSTADDGYVYFTRTIKKNGVVSCDNGRLSPVDNCNNQNEGSGLSMINNDVVAAELAAKFPKNKFM